MSASGRKKKARGTYKHAPVPRLTFGLDLASQFAALCLLSHQRCSGASNKGSELRRLAIRTVWQWVVHEAPVRLVNLRLLREPRQRGAVDWEALLTLGVSEATLAVVPRETRHWARETQGCLSLVGANRVHLIERVRERGEMVSSKVACFKGDGKLYRTVRDAGALRDCDGACECELGYNKVVVSQAAGNICVNQKWVVLGGWSWGSLKRIVIVNLLLAGQQGEAVAEKVITSFSRDKRLLGVFLDRYHCDEALFVWLSGELSVEVNIVNLEQLWSSPNTFSPIISALYLLPSTSLRSAYDVQEQWLVLRTESNKRSFIVKANPHIFQTVILQYAEISADMQDNLLHSAQFKSQRLELSQLSERLYCVSAFMVLLSEILTVEIWDCNTPSHAISIVECRKDCHMVFGHAGFLFYDYGDHVVITDYLSGTRVAELSYVVPGTNPGNNSFLVRLGMGNATGGNSDEHPPAQEDEEYTSSNAVKGPPDPPSVVNNSQFFTIRDQLVAMATSKHRRAGAGSRMGALLDDAAMAGIAWMLVRMQPHVPVIMEPRMKDRLYTAAVVVAPNGNARAVALEGAFSDDAVGTCGSQRVLFATQEGDKRYLDASVWDAIVGGAPVDKFRLDAGDGMEFTKTSGRKCNEKWFVILADRRRVRKNSCLHAWLLRKGHFHNVIDLEAMIPACCKDYTILQFDFTFCEPSINCGDELSILLGVWPRSGNTEDPHSNAITIHILHFDLSKPSSAPTHISFPGAPPSRLCFLWGGRLILHKDHNNTAKRRGLILTDTGTGIRLCRVRELQSRGTSIYAVSETHLMQHNHSTDECVLWAFGQPDQQLAYGYDPTSLMYLQIPTKTSLTVPHLALRGGLSDTVPCTGIGGGYFVTVRGEYSPCLDVHNAYTTATVTDTLTSSSSLLLGSLRLQWWM
ncbi:hypothetical protein Pelo_5633 [Pelomyxa schiedti]|nr:hypothetical protein Pelo_5633 [Pelomyxa schiedti]